MSKFKTIDSFFKRNRVDSEDDVSTPPIDISLTQHDSHPITANISFKRPRNEEVDPPSINQQDDTPTAALTSVPSTPLRPIIERDPGLRIQIWEYPINQQDEIRRAYIKEGPYQHKLVKYPASGGHNRKFQSSWFVKFYSWLEYSPSKDAAFCLPCVVFNKPTSGRFGSSTFTIEGFKNWKKVYGKDCAFLAHVRKDHCSPHDIAIKSCKDLMAPTTHIDKVMDRKTSREIAENRLRLVASIDALRYCAFQAIAFRGHDESADSINRGNFIEMIKKLAQYDKRVDDVVLDNAPRNAKDISSQKEILSILSRTVQKAIREEIGEAKYFILVDESRDESKMEQMAIVIRFVDINGFVRERFLDLVHVKDKTADTLKTQVSIVLKEHNLSIQDMRGQGYDGASNMRGQWNGLKAKFLEECPYAYYVHCFAHKLQLALVAVSREVKSVHNFFNELIYIVNTIGAASKRNDLLHDAQKDYIQHMVDLEEIETGTGANQIGALQRPGDTQWSSHFSSICSLLKMYNATCSVLLEISDNASLYVDRGDAEAAFKKLKKYKFVFILHLMKEVLGITDGLCQCLQYQPQDILNAMNLVSSTKVLIQNLRETGWDNFLHNVRLFCEKNEVKVPDMNAPYIDRCSRTTRDNITVEHHYRYDIFNFTLDSEWQELNDRFNKDFVDLLRLSKALDPKDGYKAFSIEDICTLAKKSYPADFTEHEFTLLKFQLQHFELDVPTDPKFQNLSRISELCRGLMETEKSKTFYLIDNLS